MKFKFKLQPYQTDAVDSIVGVFSGQPKSGPLSYPRQIGNRNAQITMDEQDIFYETAFCNAEITLTKDQLLNNINTVQIKNNIKTSPELVEGLGAVSLDVEMETGTGKTYVYIKTMFQLYETYGWSKFIIIVPSIAIREGVKKSFEITQEHFMEHYGRKARFFVYNSSNLHQLDEYSQNDGLNVMIINTQAFYNTLGENEIVDDQKSNEAGRIIYTKRDEFGSRRPIDVIRANRPIIILDEPQKMGGPATQNALKRNFDPLFSINYSATHKTSHNLVYVLDALDAYKNKLVKKIEVKGLELKNISGTNRYLYLSDIIVNPKKPPSAKIEIEEKRSDGTIHRNIQLFKVEDNIYDASNGLEEYKGLRITAIDPGHSLVELSNGISIAPGEAIGDVNENDIRRIQIRETIVSHFDKEEKLFEQGIKCLSLFFVDEVSKYRQYDKEGNAVLGQYGKIFEEEYGRELHSRLPQISADYSNYLRSIDVSECHQGYFSVDKKGKFINSKKTRGNEYSDDISAYELILKNKERLLSFDEPTRFVFSHSALREGWDNPNIFQICTLKHSYSATAKRQEVGRGLRLCVNKHGIRQDEEVCGERLVHGVNVLTVIANESYINFVEDLQREVKSDLVKRPEKASMEYFMDRKMLVGEEIHSITASEARSIYHYLVRNNYIDDDGAVTEVYRAAAQINSFEPLSHDLEAYKDSIHKLIQAIFDPIAFSEMTGNAHDTRIKQNTINENWSKFEQLWNRINKKYAYIVDFDSQELIDNSIRAIEENLSVSGTVYTLTTGRQTGQLAPEFARQKTETKELSRSVDNSIKYDLVDKISGRTSLTRKTIVAILQGLSIEKLGKFKINPEEFISKVSILINQQKASVVIEQITYNQTEEDPFSRDIFNLSRASVEYEKIIAVKKAIQDYIPIDGISQNSVEKRFAEDLDIADEVVVYAKLPSGPRGFYIPTPVGKYSPDWAILFKKDSVKHIFFIAETKGSMNSGQIRPIEQAKIECAKKLFNNLPTNGVKYHNIDTYENLLAVMNSI